MNLALARLLQLASPTLPVGAYTYSQGLEWAVECGDITDEAGALRWIGDQLEWNLGRFEAPLLSRLIEAWGAGDDAAIAALDARYCASRESVELRAETLQMGHSLRRLIADLPDMPASFVARLDAMGAASYPTVWAGLVDAWRIEPCAALLAWLWSWAENQTLAALKTVPLGQAAGQRILLAIGARLPACVDVAHRLVDDEWSNFAPGFAIACARHETQYSRLFRS